MAESAIPLDRNAANMAAAQAKLDAAREEGRAEGRAEWESKLKDALAHVIAVAHNAHQGELTRHDAQWRSYADLASRAGHRSGMVHGGAVGLIAGAVCVYIALQAGWFGNAAARALEQRGTMEPAPLTIREPEDAPREALSGYSNNPVTGRRIAPPASAPESR